MKEPDYYHIGGRIIGEKPTATVSDVALWSLILVNCVTSRGVIVDSALGVALGSMAVGEP